MSSNFNAKDKNSHWGKMCKNKLMKIIFIHFLTKNVDCFEDISRENQLKKYLNDCYNTYLETGETTCKVQYFESYKWSKLCSSFVIQMILTPVMEGFAMAQKIFYMPVTRILVKLRYSVNSIFAFACRVLMDGIVNLKTKIA